MTQHPTDAGKIAQGGSEAARTDILARVEEHRSDSPRGLPWGLADELAAEVTRLHTWDGLMSLLDEHWPADIFPTLPDNPDRDPGPRIISLLRWVDNQRAEVERLRGALKGLADGWRASGVLPNGVIETCIADVQAVLRGDQ